MAFIDTHNVVMNFGKHNGELLTRVPVGYLRWMMNTEGLDRDWKALARAEYERRGTQLPTVEISGHAIDKASLRVLGVWNKHRGPDEGLHAWLMRVTLEALRKGERLENGKIRYLGMKLVIQEGEEFPVLKTIMS